MPEQTKEPQCKQEKYAGGGCPSPRVCEICDVGPCTKKVASADAKV